MPESKNESRRIDQPPSWRQYQDGLKKRQSPFSAKPWIIRLAVISIGLMGAFKVASALIPPTHVQAPPPTVEAKAADTLITKKDVQLLVEQADLNTLLAEEVRLPFNTRQIQIKTSLNADLQAHLLKSMDRKNSRYIGIVVMEGTTGRVLSLAGFNKVHPEFNPCLVNDYPAASIFKIVTAAAAVDHCGYNENTVMKFNGYKHTLYKSQLKERNNRHTNRVSFKDSFAQSVNPVFGKLGTLYLGQSVLEQSAEAFGFNQPIDFELPVAPSRIHVKPKPYHWAEIASGFNHDTTISPLHAAVMASAVLNKGRMVAPTIIDRIIDDEQQLLYRSQTHWSGQAMSAKASDVLARLMETTVRSGTGRKSFRDRRRHRILSKLTIGGKTGSLFNRGHDARFDWFVGFAKEKSGGADLVVAVLVAHEEFIGIRATQYARMAMTYYFKDQLARRENNNSNSDG